MLARFSLKNHGIYFSEYILILFRLKKDQNVFTNNR